jgi:L-asparaginase
MLVRPMPRVLVLHTGGTLGMDASSSFDMDAEGHVRLKEGTGGRYHKPNHHALKPGEEGGALLGRRKNAATST